MSVVLPPTIVPPFLVVGKEETVVIEFKNNFASLQELITVDFFDDATKRLNTSPCNQLGPSTIKVHFPAFCNPGTIEVVPKIDRQLHPLFPKFKVHVASPVETIYNRLSCNRAQDNVAVLSCILSYITHLSSEDVQTARLQSDTIICTLLNSMPTVPQWNLAPFLCGDRQTNDNLLHFAARYHLDGMAEHLSRHISKNTEALSQLSLDKRTPLEIAKKNGLMKMLDTLQRLQTIYGPQAEKKSKNKKVLKKEPTTLNEQERVSEQDHLSVTNASCRTSTISSSSAHESIYSNPGTENETNILKALSDISSHCLYKAKVTRDYQMSSYPHGELSLKVGDIVCVTREEGEVCMGIVDLNYGQIPTHVLQRIRCNNPGQPREGSEYYKVPRLQHVYIDDDTSDDEAAVHLESNHIYDIPRSARLNRKVVRNGPGVPKSCSCETGLDHIGTEGEPIRQALREMQVQLDGEETLHPTTTTPTDSKSFRSTSNGDTAPYCPEVCLLHEAQEAQSNSNSQKNPPPHKHQDKVPSLTTDYLQSKNELSSIYTQEAAFQPNQNTHVVIPHLLVSHPDVKAQLQSSTTSISTKLLPQLQSNLETTAAAPSSTEPADPTDAVQSIQNLSFLINIQETAPSLLSSDRTADQTVTPPFQNLSTITDTREETFQLLPSPNHATSELILAQSRNQEIVSSLANTKESELHPLSISARYHEDRPQSLNYEQGSTVSDDVTQGVANAGYSPEKISLAAQKPESIMPNASTDFGTAQTLVARETISAHELVSTHPAHLTQIPQESATKETTDSVPKSPRPRPKPRKLCSLPTSESLENRSELLSAGLPPECIPSAMDLCNGTPNAEPIMVVSQTSTNNASGPLSSMVMKKVPPPISPRAKRLNKDGTPVSPGVRNLPTETAPPISPRRQRLQTVFSI